MTTVGKGVLEGRLRAAAEHVEAEIRRLIAYLNDEVVPDVRQNGSAALRAASAELQRLAQQMDEDGRGISSSQRPTASSPAGAPPPPARPADPQAR